MAEKILAFRVDVIGVSKEAQEITKLDTELKKLNADKRESNKLYKEGKKSETQHNADLAKITSKTKDLQVQKAKLNQVERQSAQVFQASSGSVNALRLKMAGLKTQMDKLNLTTKTGQKDFQRLNAQYQQGTATLRKYDQRMAGSARLQGAFSKGIVSSMKSMASGFLGITAAIKVFRDIIKVTGDFDTATAKLASVTGKTREEIADLTDEARLLGATTIFTASQVTDLQVALAKLGFTANEIQNATASVLDFATATDADLGAAAKVAGVAVRAFGLDSLETGNAVATLAVATTKSALAFEDYETILGTVGPVARSYGFTLEDTIALTGKLRDAGFDASKSSTALRNIFLNLADSGGALAKKLGGPVRTMDELVAAMIDLDDQGISLNETLDVTDKRSVAAFITLLKGSDSVGKLRDEISDANEKLDEMVKIKLDSYAGDVKALGSAWEGLILSLKTSGGIRWAIQGMKDFILELQNLDIALRKFNKLDNKDLVRAFDLMESLDNRRGKHFSAMLEFYDKFTDEAIASRGMEQMVKDFAMIQGVNKKEADALANEYLRRRAETAAKDIEIEAAKNARITEEAIAQEKARQSEINAEKAKAEAKAAAERVKVAAAAKAEAEKAAAAALEQAMKGPDGSGAKQLEEDYKLALGAIMIEFDAWGDIQEKSYDDLTNEQLQAWARETQAFREKEAEELAIARTKEEQIKAIKQASIDLVFQGLDTIAAFQQRNMNAELAMAGDNAKKKEEIQKKYAKKEQKIAIVSALINTAIAVTKALGSGPPPLNFILAAITGAAGALQVASIAAQKFAHGGLVRPGSELSGMPKSGDNTLALVKPGEVILNKRQQSVVGGPKVFQKAGVPGFASGGIVGPTPNTSRMDQSLSLANQMADIRVTLNLNELNEAQGELVVINEDSGL